MDNKKPITVLTAPSCAGKDYLSKCLFEQFPGLFEMAVSCTTRPPREGEIDGKDYNFLSLEDFRQMQVSDRLLESVEFGSKCYGTSANEIERIQSQGRFPVLIVEPVGAINIWNWCKENDQPAQFAFIDVDREVALERFLDRFLKDYTSLLEKSEDEFLSNSGDFDFDNSVNSLINNYAKRIYISMYEESSWSEYLPYNLKLGKMVNHDDSLSAATRIKKRASEIEQGEAPGIPDTLQSIPKGVLSKKPDSLFDMEKVIKKTLSTIKNETVNSVYLKGIILKSENERLNQLGIQI